MDLNLRIAGEAGQGVQTTGNLLVGAFARMGLSVFATQSYLSRIRGGLNWFDVRIADRQLFSSREDADLLVALLPEALPTLQPHMSEGGVVLLDPGPDASGGSSDAPGCIALALTKTAKDVGGSEVMANTVAAGAAMRVLGYPLDGLLSFLADEFKKKGEETVAANRRCAEAGANLFGSEPPHLNAPKPRGKAVSLAGGTQAIVLGAASAGVKFVCGYPMTPGTGVLQGLAAVGDSFGIMVEQAEDEIAAVNMACGATYAGVPALVATSGGGFALMAEGLALAGMLELPLVIVIAQRPGPATGLPTRTAQQDLLFALHAGHGEFPRAIYAPGTPEQAYTIARRALETAHKFQSPALILTDQFLMDLQTDTPPLDATLRPIDRCILADPPEPYVRYAVTESGVSPRAIPGGKALVIVDSDEHTEDGHITEDLEARVRLQDKRLRKAGGLRAEAMAPERYGPEDAERLLVCWGSTYGPCREAVDILRERGASVAMLHFAQVWPLDSDKVRNAIAPNGKSPHRIQCVEGNATGQFASLLRTVGAIAECESVLEYDGLPFTGRGLAERIGHD
ncbi:MAG: 2-oxoacid:acceptor oxidoreductase subunit alpha [Phycisphaerae bacterium]